MSTSINYRLFLHFDKKLNQQTISVQKSDGSWTVVRKYKHGSVLIQFFSKGDIYVPEGNELKDVQEKIILEISRLAGMSEEFISKLTEILMLLNSPEDEAELSGGLKTGPPPSVKVGGDRHGGSHSPYDPEGPRYHGEF